MNEVKDKGSGNNTIDKGIQRTTEIRFKTRICFCPQAKQL